MTCTRIAAIIALVITYIAWFLISLRLPPLFRRVQSLERGLILIILRKFFERSLFQCCFSLNCISIKRYLLAFIVTLVFVYIKAFFSKERINHWNIVESSSKFHFWAAILKMLKICMFVHTLSYVEMQSSLLPSVHSVPCDLLSWVPSSCEHHSHFVPL